jgi:hypothetical protein
VLVVPPVKTEYAVKLASPVPPCGTVTGLLVFVALFVAIKP